MTDDQAADAPSPHVTGTSVLDVFEGAGISALENAVDAEIRKLEIDGYEILSVSHAAMQELSGDAYWTAIITYRKPRVPSPREDALKEEFGGLLEDGEA